jgi:hypothetical protein
MFQRARRGLAIAGSSMKVLLNHPALILFPMSSTLFGIGLLLVVSGTVYFGHLAEFHWPFYVLIAFAFYIMAIFNGVFFNVALVSCIFDVFADRKISLRNGIHASVAHLYQIVVWTFYAAVVGFLLRFLQGLLRKFGVLGGVFGGAVGIGWGIATFFVIPVLVAEDVMPKQAIARSAELIKRNWGNAVGIEVGFVIILFLALIPPVLLIAFVNSYTALPIPHTEALTLSFGVSVFFLAVVLNIVTVLETTFRTGVYLFAMGLPPKAMDHALKLGSDSI